MQKLFFALLGFILLQTAGAQQPLQFSFAHYNTTNGLLSNQVNTVVQDAEGYLWTGSTDGLQRFDGIRYKSFRHHENDSSTIPSNPVWQLLIDKKNNLWVLLADGKVGLFDTKKFTFREVHAIFKKPVSPNTFLKRLISDEFGNLFYLMGGSEVITWNAKSDDFSYSHNFFLQKEEWGIADFIQEPGTEKYWISIEHGGLSVYNKKTGHLSYAGNNADNEKTVDRFAGTKTYNHLFFDRQKRLWSFIQDRFPSIVCYDRNTDIQVLEKTDFSTYLKSQYEIKGFFQQKDGTIWVTGLLVFARYEEAEKKFRFVLNGYQNDKGIVYEMVHCLYEDNENNLWIGTDNNGLYRFNPSTEFFLNVKYVNPVTGQKGEADLLSFVQTRQGTVLAGTQGDGIYQYDKNLNLIPLNIRGLKTPHEIIAWSMCASADSHTIWISSHAGIHAIDQTTQSAKFFNQPLLENKKIRQVAEDKKGNLWLGTEADGIYKWDAAFVGKDIQKGLTAFKTIPPVAVNKITVDARGLVWIATPENGVYVIDPQTNQVTMRFTDKAEGAYQLPEAGVSSILEYDDSTIIITTATRIVRYNRIMKRSSTVGTPATISGFIAAVEKDKNGYLWLTSSNGLYRINLQKKIFIYYNRTDGIDNDHFIQSSSYTLSDGRIFFGSTNQFIVFDPLNMQASPVSPNIRLTEFRVMDKTLVLDSLMNLKIIELGYRDNSLTIEFSPLVFSYPYLIKYKMEGLDKEWRVADKNYQAIYSYLPPGEYVFSLKGMDEEGNELTNIFSLKIKAAAPFWKTSWFYALLFLAAGSILYVLDRERMKRKESVYKMRNDIADDLHQEVNMALSNINILSEMANLKAGREPEKSREYIEQIHFRSHNIMHAMDDMLWSIKPENDNISKAIERLREHIDALKNRHGVKISLLVDQKVETLKLDMKQRRDVFWLLKGGITSVVRSGATDCNVHIALRKQKLIYTLEFDKTHLNEQQMNNLLQREELAKKLAVVKGVIQAQLHKTRPEIELTIPII